MKNIQLARIKSPNINSVDYANNMAGVFENINENFKKLASLPFLQGIKGDSFEQINKPIWVFDDAKQKYVATEEGAKLLSSIYKIDFSKNPVMPDNNNIKNAFLKDGKLYNNDLIFYSIFDDAGDEITTKLGQYYYFVDPEVKELGVWFYDNKTKELELFKDKSGFYMYNPNINNETPITETYIKTNFLPTLYYDVKTNDICWMFNSVETGISAIGVPGKNGNDSKLQYVKVAPTEIDGLSSKVEAFFDPKSDSTNENFWNNNIKGNVTPGNALVFIPFDNSDDFGIAFGETFYSDDGKGGLTAYWENKALIIPRAFNPVIADYFFNMRYGNSTDAPEWLAIPSNPTVTADSKTNAHAFIATKDKGNSNVLEIKHIANGFPDIIDTDQKYTDGPEMQIGDANENTLRVKNYTVKIGDDDKTTTISNDTVTTNKISASELTSTTIISNEITANKTIKSRINGVSNVVLNLPIGSIVMWPTNTPPEGWLLCDGRQFTKDEYPELYNVLNEGKVPDFSYRFPLGKDNSLKLKDTGGDKDVILEANQGAFPGISFTHDHDWQIQQSGDAQGNWSSNSKITGKQQDFDNNRYGLKHIQSYGEQQEFVFNKIDGNGNWAYDDSKSNFGAFSILEKTISIDGKKAEKSHNNMPPYLVINFIIKAK